MNVSNNDDIGGLEFRLLCVKSSSFTANCDDYFSFQKILILKKILKVFYFDFLLRAVGRAPTGDLRAEAELFPGQPSSQLEAQ